MLNPKGKSPPLGFIYSYIKKNPSDPEWFSAL